MSELRASRWRALRAARSESGSATVEFVILFPLFVLIFLSIFELSVLMARQTLLDRAVDLSVRSLRLGEVTPLTHAGLKTDICANARYISNCEDTLQLQLRPVSTERWDIETDAAPCADGGQITPGGADQLMLVHACVVVDPFFPTTGLALHLADETAAGGYAMVSVSAFVNEPA